MLRNWTPTRIVLTAVLVAFVTVLTYAVRVPIAPTRGYIHLGDVGVFFAAFTFGPAVGFLAGGLGTGLADVLGGYAQWAIPSFVIHGAQALVAGYIGFRQSYQRQLLGWLAGGLIVVVGYFLVAAALYGVGAALVEVPGNFMQVTAGGLVAIPLATTLRHFWPPIEHLGLPRVWQER